MSEEHDSGNPPPRTSSREGIPVDVINVEIDEGEYRVPAGKVICFDDVFLLNDMAGDREEAARCQCHTVAFSYLLIIDSFLPPPLPHSTYSP